ncbi:unnamed protein product [Pieris brassicae]|uniref:Pre-rRNA-processing protein Ipi1 N-terminal domain-containing protein n=1 Tax=Pieris brassicae TaxID=7116 RepID=A0A9P0XGM2_PIEBR|nr:unnamed protein product [Pieris brassicae]
MHKTGATRHKKFLKAEKSKTKLKGKKDPELPKGTNVTKTNFKVKKIVIKEQLKKHVQSEALSTRKLNVKELLSRLNHFNATSRTDALDGLKEIISSNPEILEQSLGPVIQGVSSLILNVEKAVRHSALKVIHLVLSNVITEKIEPFFDIMSTYLRSAMTHIDSRIQEDSLLFLDILLLCAPDKAAQDFHKIIPNFLDMISKLRTDAKPGRTLTVNLNSQITSVKWRVKVLNRLKDFLQKFAEYNHIFKLEKANQTKIQTFNKDGPNYYPLFNPIHISPCVVSCFSTKTSENVLQIDEIEKFREYVETLMPLLFETWLEASPNLKSDRNMETVVSEDAALLMKHLLEVITTIWDIVKYYNEKAPSSKIKNLFCLKYKSLFTQNICNSFPYVTNVRSKQTKNADNTEDIITDPKLVTENLQICYLFIVLNPHINIKHEGKTITSVLHYIEKMFGKSNENINNRMLKILHTIFSKEVTGWTKNTTVMDTLFQKIISFYLQNEGTDVFKQQIFSLLCQIALNDKLSHLHSNVLYEQWLKNLPNILLGDSISGQTVDILHKFAVTKNNLFNSVLKPKLLSIIGNLPKIIIKDCTSNGDYHKMLSLLYWINPWDTESLNLLENQLMQSQYRGDHGKYIFDTLRLKSGGIL